MYVSECRLVCVIKYENTNTKTKKIVIEQEKAYCLKLEKAMQESIKDGEMFTRYHFAKLVAEKALAEHAMRETQRLGQEIEPVADYIAARDMLDAKPVPPRTWVGLTDEDMYVVSEEESCSFIAGAKWSEAILKEKNT